MLVFDPKKESWSVFRLPYPMPFYTRGLDGRIDDAEGGLERPRHLGHVQLLHAQVHRNAHRLRDTHSNSPEPVGELKFLGQAKASL